MNSNKKFKFNAIIELSKALWCDSTDVAQGCGRIIKNDAIGKASELG